MYGFESSITCRGGRVAPDWRRRLRSSDKDEWDDVQVELDDDGLVIGDVKHVRLDKKDRQQDSRWKGTPCASDCTGNVEVADDGTIDASAMCPVHLCMLLKVGQGQG